MRRRDWLLEIRDWRLAVASSTDRTVREILLELRRQLEQLYGSRLRRLVLYGSQARGSATADSDIDVLVVLKGPVEPAVEVHRTSHIVSQLSLEHDVVIVCVFVDEYDLENEQSMFMANIRREGIVA